jgi:hypothetical protein
MKVSNISSELKFVNRLGVTLSVEERISIEAQALRLSHEYKHDQWNFWGRIEGIVKNYYIIEGVDFKGVTNFPNRQYFWAYGVLYLEMMILSLLNYLLLGNSILLKLIHRMTSFQDNMKEFYLKTPIKRLRFCEESMENK